MICVGISFFNWNFRVVIYLYYLDRWCWETWVHHLERSQIGIIPTLWKRKQNNTKPRKNWRPRRKGKPGQLEQTEDEDNEGSREWVIQHDPGISNNKDLYFSSYNKIVARTFLCAPKPALFPPLPHWNSQMPLQFAVSTVDISGMWTEVMCATSRTGPYTLSINILPCFSL